MNKIMEIAKSALVQLHGTDSCKRMADMPSSEVMFTILRENVEKEYSKYKGQLEEEKYQQYIEEIFQVYKEYKLQLDKVEEHEYGKAYGDYAERLIAVNKKYDIKSKN